MKTAIASVWKSLETGMCRTATLSSTTTTVRGTDWTVRSARQVMTGPGLKAKERERGRLKGGSRHHTHTHTHIHPPFLNPGSPVEN